MLLYYKVTGLQVYKYIFNIYIIYYYKYSTPNPSMAKVPVNLCNP